MNFEVIGFVDDKIPENNNRHKFLGRLGDLDELIKKFNINEVIIPESSFKISRIIEILEQFKDMKVSYKFSNEFF